jgi:hypothetical protein
MLVLKLAMCKNNKECNKDHFGNIVSGTWELTVSNPNPITCFPQLQLSQLLSVSLGKRPSIKGNLILLHPYKFLSSLYSSHFTLFKLCN